MKKKHLLYSFIFILVSCSRNSVNNEDGYIPVDNTERINFTDLFKEYKLIFPESKDSAWFGLYISKIEIIDKKMFLLNQSQRGSDILCFDENGHFLFNIDKVGNGPGEYLSIIDFMVDRQLSTIVLSVVGNKYGYHELMYFSLDGEYLYSKKGPDIPEMMRQIKEFNDSLYVVFSNYNGMEDYKEIIFMDRKNLNLKYSIDCTDIFTAGSVPGLCFSMANDTFLFYGGNDTIYDISTELGKKTPMYSVDFGKQQREHKRSLIGKTHDEILDLQTEAFQNKRIRSARRLTGNDKFLAINYDENESVKKEYDLCFQTVFFDRTAKKSYNTTNMNFDIFNSIKNNKMEVVGCADGYFYAVQRTPFSMEEIEDILKSKYLPEESKQALQKMNDDSNPIILVFK
jgi:hypothetical protein